MPKITQLFAYVLADRAADDEGVPAVQLGDLAHPLMGADMARAKSIRRMAQDVANQTGKNLRLVRSTGLEVVEVVYPEVKKK